jgi:KaiC/GvpD/RAD55 family RecA-like ATPase
MVEVCASAYKMLYRGEEFHPAHRRQFMAFTTIAVAGKGGTGKTTFAAF